MIPALAQALRAAWDVGGRRRSIFRSEVQERHSCRGAFTSPSLYKKGAQVKKEKRNVKGESEERRVDA